MGKVTSFYVKNYAVFGKIKKNILEDMYGKCQALDDACRECAEELWIYSNDQVPVDTGYLSNQGTILKSRDGYIVRYSALAGDRAKAAGLPIPLNEDFNYAYIQHEDLTFNHKNGRKAKYLSDPLEEHEDEWFNRMCDAVENAMPKSSPPNYVLDEVELPLPQAPSKPTSTGSKRTRSRNIKKAMKRKGRK